MDDGGALSSPLFRQEALDEASSRYGAPVRSVGVASWVLVAFMVALLLTTVAFITTARFSRKETVQGMIVPSAGAIKLTSLRAGVVAEVFVEEGSVVAANTPVARISVDSTVDGGQAVGTLVNRASEAEEKSLQNQLSARSRLTAEMQRDLGVRRAALLSEISELKEQISLQKEKIQLSREGEDASAILLQKGVITAQDHRQRQSTRLVDEQTAARLRHDLQEANKSLAQLDVEERRIAAQNTQDAAKLAGDAAELQYRKAQSLAQQDIIVVADRAGRITALEAKPGKPVSPGSPIGVLLPAGAQLQVHLWVPSKAVGFLRPGDEVRIMYDAFPYQRFGIGAGRVFSVSAAPVSQADLPISHLQASNSENLYDVVVAIDHEYIEAYGQKWPLLAGMQLKADLVLEKRSLLTWLFDPLRAANARHSGA